MSAGTYTLRFWGARGTVPTPARENLRYGGHTSCLSLALGEDEHLVLDCGSGLRLLGKSLAPLRPEGSRRFHFLLSHYHYDHLEGLPYFPPLYDPRTAIAFHGFAPAGSSVKETLEGFIRPPYFPVSLAGAPARREYHAADREPLVLGDLIASSLPLNHPDGSLAWRLEHAGRRVVFATDHEHGHQDTDLALERFAARADLLIYDATYVPAEYDSLRRGWGHSTWYAAVALARAARVGTLALFHHHPDHSDDELERLLAFARAELPCTVLAREGMEFAF